MAIYSILPSTNLRYQDIRDTLNANGGTVGNTSADANSIWSANANINMWAKYKPVIYNTPAEINDEQRYQVNYGLDIDAAHSLDIVGLFDKAKTNSAWSYKKPVIGTNWMRIADFINYNPNAKPIFNYRHIPSQIDSYDNTADTTISIEFNTDRQISLSDLVYLAGLQGYGTFKYALAIRKTSDISNVYFSYGRYVDTSYSPVLIDVHFPSVGTWECLFIVTHETEEHTTAQDSIFMHEGFFNVVINRIYAWAKVYITNATNLSLRLESGQIFGFNWIQLQAQAIGASLSSTVGELFLNVQCIDSSGYSIGQFDVYSPNEAGRFEYSGTAVQNYTLDYMLGGYIDIRNYLSVTDAEKTAKCIVHADITIRSGSGVFALDKIYEWTINR